MKAVILLFSFVVSSQALASSLDDALKAAMGSAEKDHASTQINLSVSPDQIIKAKFQRPKATAKINLDKMGVDDSILTDEEEVYEVEQEIAAKPELKSTKQLGDI